MEQNQHKKYEKELKKSTVIINLAYEIGVRWDKKNVWGNMVWLVPLAKDLLNECQEKE